MTTRKFNADLRAAISAVEHGTTENVVVVSRGDSDGEFTLLLGYPDVEQLFEIRLLAANVDDYPQNNSFIVFTNDDAVPDRAAAAFAALQESSSGRTVNDMIGLVKERIGSALAAPSDSEMGESGGKASSADGSGEESDEDSSDDEAITMDYADVDDPDGDAAHFGLEADQFSTVAAGYAVRSAESMDRIKRDFRKVLEQGFKVGILSGIEASSRSSIFSISVRVNKLGLSEEALEAWDVSAASYLVLLVRIDGMYPALEKITDFGAGLNVEFRIGSCKQYKPSLAQATKAFIISKSQDPPAQPSCSVGPAEAVFSKLFISQSLERFMSENLVALLKLRIAKAVSWDEANAILNSKQQGLSLGGAGSATGSSGGAAGASHGGSSLPDHVTDRGERSFPLVAMQFALRYFVGCTKFCLCCHRPLDGDFEALKPYVCMSPLCLFQYLNLRLGQSVEHEIVTQPYVVDLLVSFCYAAVQSLCPSGPFGGPGLREFPVGLHIRVPGIYEVSRTSSPIKVRATTKFEKIVVVDRMDLKRLDPNTWVVFQRRRSEKGGALEPRNTYLDHGYILGMDGATGELQVDMRGQSGCSIPEVATTAEALYPEMLNSAAGSLVLMDMYLYEVDLDAMGPQDKAPVMAAILDSLPPIMQIRDHLINNPDLPLKSFDKISPAAAALLEWIIASNRSCIFQVDQEAEEEKSPANAGGGNEGATTAGGAAVPLKTRLDEMVLGMGGWLQFRFAQGAPDKEVRFNRALAEVAARRHLEYPTLFAWHGSSMRNWHSILRHGLDFKEVHNGRAFGHGVYFSHQFQSSNQYAQTSGSVPWQNSALMVTSALSLNEIINVPDEFVSHSPHYVVNQVDWIQPRYLFVQCRPRLVGPGGGPKLKASGGSGVALQGVQLVRQDPARLVQGPSGNPLKIPLKAIPRSRSQAEKSASKEPLASRRQNDGKAAANAESDEEDAADAEFLFSEAGDGKAPAAGLSRLELVEGARLDKAATDFRPGSLDLESLPRMPPPAWATDFATKQIAREVKKLSDTQAKTPCHELGWFIDFDKLDNLFQWIVELHSFEPGLPLAQDMKSAGVASVVLEIRFGKDFPYSPPFVRVIRPRFLAFVNGGGGHVTLGGALCMELLTTSGWTPANSMESVLLQVRMALCSTDPHPARLAPGLGKSSHHTDYGIADAVGAYIRACKNHGWKVPADLQEMTGG